VRRWRGGSHFHPTFLRIIAIRRPDCDRFVM
jgi:hypothetical protein